MFCLEASALIIAMSTLYYMYFWYNSLLYPVLYDIFTCIAFVVIKCFGKSGLPWILYFQLVFHTVSTSVLGFCQKVDHF